MYACSVVHTVVVVGVHGRPEYEHHVEECKLEPKPRTGHLHYDVIVMSSEPDGTDQNDGRPGNMQRRHGTELDWGGYGAGDTMIIGRQSRTHRHRWCGKEGTPSVHQDAGSRPRYLRH